MALHVIRRTTPIQVEQIVLSIIGQGGIGKTSLAYTASRPVLLDFDEGAHRSGFRYGDTLRMDSWEDTATLDPSLLTDRDTVIVDTAGRALDKLTEYIIATEPKMAMSSGALTLKGYGALKATFVGWVKRLRESGKDVVLLAHDAEEKDGDDVRIRADIQGGSRQEIIKVADAMGYLHLVGKDRVLDFTQTEKWFAKNCAGLPPLVVPNLHEKPDFLATVIADIKTVLNRRSEEQQKAVEELEALKARIAAAESAEEFNALVEVVKGADIGIREALKKILVTTGEGKGLSFDRAKLAFVEKAVEVATP